ncbi:MAG: YcxB family protein [Dorea sp.]|nr:YcxB family protein [Dorea sp.]
MTTLYEVKTGHTKKVLMAFAKFYNENGKNYRRLMFRYGISAALFFTLPKALKLSGLHAAACFAAGIFIIALAFARPYLTYFGMLGRDIYYKYGIKIVMSFGHSGFTVQDNEKHMYKYHEIEKLYADSEIYYLHMEGGDLYIVPKEDFVQGSPDDFYKFMQQSTGKEFGEAHVSLKQKLFRMNAGITDMK